MNYLIVFIVIALVLSPVFWMMPSPRQKRQMQLRQRAMELGFQVKVTDLPQTHRAKVRKEPPEQGVVYRLPWQKARGAGERFHHLVLREEQDSQSVSEKSQVEEWMKRALSTLPENVMAFEYATPGVAIYWQEQGNVTMVEGLYDSMMKLQTELLSGV